MTRPLAGITVVSLEHAVAAPYATRQLADLGARVIKVERPGTGDFARQYDRSVNGLSSYFVWLNRSKESVALDIKSDNGREVLHELVDRADVFVQNLGPGAAQRLGLGADAILQRDPRKITLSITGWGSNGPWSKRKAYDLLAQCESGVVSLTGSPAQPARVGVSIADIAAGMYGFSGILAALYQREVTGLGTSLEVSLFEALAEWMGQPMHYTAGSGSPPNRVGMQHSTIAPYGPFATKDGKTIVIGIQSEPEWIQFCESFLGDAAIADDEQFTSNSLRVAHRDRLNGIISKRFEELDAVTVISLLEKSNVAYGGVNSMSEFIDHPVLKGRDRWRTIETPEGAIPALLPPIQFSGAEARMDPVPSLGEHTISILTELGRSKSDVAQPIEGDVV